MGIEYFRFTVLAGYFLMATLALLCAFVQDKFNRKIKFYSIVVLGSFFLFFILLFGLRDFSIGTDTVNYNYLYLNYKTEDFGPDFLMFFLISGLNFFFSSSRSFFVLMSFLYLAGLVYSLYKFSLLFQANVFLLFFSCLSLFFFYNLGVNIIRQGVSLMFFLVGVSSFLQNSNKRILFMFFILSLGFHITSIVPILVFLIVRWTQKVNLGIIVTIYVISIIIALNGGSLLDIRNVISQILLGEKFNAYLINDSPLYDIGFKPQFVIFNSLFLILFFKVRNLLETDLMKDSYEVLLRLYLVLSSLFFMTFQMPYSDRWGIMSWVLIPILFSPIFSLKFRFRASILGVILFMCIFILFLKNLNQF